jgi:protein TonB
MENAMVAGRLGRMGIVAGMHVAAFYMIASGLGIVPTLVETPERVVTTIIEDRPVQDDPLPRTDPVPSTPPITVPIPEVPPIEQPRADDGIVAQPIDPLRVDAGPGSADPVPAIVPVRQDVRHPLSQPRYPSPDIREGNEGNADVEVYVLANGRVGEARIARSTGFPRLDQSAIDEAKRNWRLIPATRNGEAIPQWYRVRVTFRITEQR